MAKVEKVETETIRLILENGEEIEVVFPLENAEGLFEEMHEAQARDIFWNVGNYRDARAMYKGYPIDEINMKRVVGIA
jgi:hypothetical protein